ncbi:MAG: TIGR04086 family membrane protein [Oscillospiraceae bacterium]
MRKRQRNSRFAPFGAGLLAGYLLTAGTSAAGALVMWLAGADSGAAWLVAVPAMALGSFLCGRTAGRLRRRGGLKTGAVCGVMYFLPLLLLSLVFGQVQGVLLTVKLLLCVGFGTAGGVAGVNSQDRA